MAKCPYCGSTDVVVVKDDRPHHGFFWWILWGYLYLIWVVIKWSIGILVFVFWDSWMFFVHLLLGRRHSWKCAYWFFGKKRVFVCGHCGRTFASY